MPPALGGAVLALSTDGFGESGGEGALGFQDWKPAGLGRGAGGAGPAAADFSKAAILSRREPGFGLGGGGWSDMMVTVVDDLGDVDIR